MTAAVSETVVSLVTARESLRASWSELEFSAEKTLGLNCYVIIHSGFIKFMDKFTSDILKYIRDNDLIKKGDRVAVGFSGGADSTALLTVLFSLRKLLGIRLIAVHVNHGIRAEEGKRDEEFSRKYAMDLGVPFYAAHIDTPGYVSETGMSEEEAGRILRYRAISDICSKVFDEDTADIRNAPGHRVPADMGMQETGHHADTDHANVTSFKIATAHHADDQAETILLNLFRGSGLRGLSGMLPRRDNIIRPLLGTGRDDITVWLRKKGISYVTDSTNLENIHTRNKLRNLILPEIKSTVNSRAAEHVAAFGKRVYEADSFITGEAVLFLDKYSGVPYMDEGGRMVMRLGRKHLKEKAQIFRIYVIIEALKRLGVPMKDWGDRHFHDIDRLLFLGRGAHADLPGSVFADNIYNETLLIRDGTH